jgi:outer membrane murein-binding lipoprotein Lpp
LCQPSRQAPPPILNFTSRLRANNVRLKIVIATAAITVADALAAESIINEHPEDVVNLLLAAVGILGGALVSVVIALEVYRINGIDKKLDRIERYLSAEVSGIKADARQDRLRIHALELDAARARERMHMAGVPQPVDYARDGE